MSLSHMSAPSEGAQMSLSLQPQAVVRLAEGEGEELEREGNRASILFKITLRMGSVGRGASERIGHFFVKPPTW